MEENKNNNVSAAVETPKKKRGFARMDPAKVKLIAALGGRAAHAGGTAHQFTSEEARAAGKKGGSAPHVSRGRSAPKAVHSSAPTGTQTTAE